MKVDFNLKILDDLLGLYPDKAIALQAKFPMVIKWLQKDDKPTFRQLTNVAKFLNIPFGYFFLNEIPEKKYPIPHFRTTDGKAFHPSSELMDTLHTLQDRQQWAKDILIELRGEKLSFTNSISVSNSVESAAQNIRAILQTDGNWARDVPTWTDALKLLINKAEDAGIFVVMNGVVNNNTRRKLNVEEFRGFVLYDDYAPFVFLNNNDAISGKIFTLIHEIAHILLGKSASFDLRRLQPAKNEVEQFCDKVAAEFLVPREQLVTNLKSIGLDYQGLARVFKVSQIVVARRLLDLEQISQQDFFSFYDEFIHHEHKIRDNKGGNFYNTVPYRISNHFFELIYNSVKQNKILYRDAFRLTNLKPKTFDEYVRKNF